ncbi:hypothetical protein HHK36_031284 [Tetracentron sinense]|uniref:UBC core domain-containing protein n=1 Tax=Tetracentron sinense TaxID=13715 RepID=A0A834YDN1_TETSI|nr:hypothetical protein HHK36_031284 [Tetracentron sinense]
MTSSSAPSRKALSKIACNRLQKELVEWQVNPPAGFLHKATDNLQRWVIEVHGASGTLYANESYQLQVDFPEHYPMEAPQVIFIPPAPMHPHIYSNGHICLVILDYPPTKPDEGIDEAVRGPITAQVKELLFDLTLVGLPLEELTSSNLTIPEAKLWRLCVYCIVDNGDNVPLWERIVGQDVSLIWKERPADNDRYVKNCRNGRSPKETRWWFHDDKV